MHRDSQKPPAKVKRAPIVDANPWQYVVTLARRAIGESRKANRRFAFGGLTAPKFRLSRSIGTMCDCHLRGIRAYKSPSPSKQY